MAKKVKLKNPHSRLRVFGFGIIDSANLTYEKYEYLLKLNPKHADQFVVSDTAEPSAKESPKEVKPKTNKNEHTNIQA
jgi:hypothetical protein